LDWSRKLVGQLKRPRDRNARARSLLALIVAEPGEHFDVLEKAVLSSHDSALFVYLHQYTRQPAEAPWRILNRHPRNLARSVKIMKQLFSLRRKAGWSVALLDLLESTYFEHDPPGFFDEVLLPLVRDIEPDNPIRRELLARVARGKFPH